MSEAGWIEQEMEEGAAVLYLTGAWRLANLTAIAEALKALRPAGGSCFVLDGSRLEELDTAAGFILYSRLAALGCDQAQGYFYSPPLAEDALITYVTDTCPRRA